MLIIFLILIFARPFISSLAFPLLNLTYSILFLTFLVFWVIFKGKPLHKIQRIKIPLSLFCLALMTSVIFSINKIKSAAELSNYITGLLLFLIVISFDDKDKIKVTRTIIMAAFIISILAIYQYFFGFKYLLTYIVKQKIPHPYPYDLDNVVQKRVFFPFVTPNILGGYLAMMIPIIFPFWDKKIAFGDKFKRFSVVRPFIKGLRRPILFRIRKVLYTFHHKIKRLFSHTFFFHLALMLAALLLTKSLGAFLSLSLGLGVYFYLRQGGYSLINNPCKEKKLIKKNLLLAVTFLIVLVLLLFTRQSAQKLDLLPTYSLSRRMLYWIETLKIIKANPWIGLGIGNFNIAYSRYAHNSYLQIWAEMGILGIISFLWLVTAVLRSSIKNSIGIPEKNWNAAMIASSIIFLAHNLIDFSFFLPETALSWWLILGLNFDDKNHT